VCYREELTEMPCETHISLYYDLKGEPTGEYSIKCAGECIEEATCKEVRRTSDDGKTIRAYCACVDREGRVSRAKCKMELVITVAEPGRVTMTPSCCGVSCGDCKVCRLVSSGRRVTILGADAGQFKVRLVEDFRCECQPIETPALRKFYQETICRLAAFAKRNGIELSGKDLYHAHVITDVGPACRDEHGNWLMDEEFMLERYQGLLAHAHEWDGGRSKDKDNFNIVVEKSGEVHFAGSTETVYATDPRVPPGVWPDQIQFRLCEPGKPCPPCTTKIHCPEIGADLCVGLRRRWPEGDPALGAR
jgi:hypothetical protein